MTTQADVIVLRYKFSFENGTSKEFVLNLDRKTLRLRHAASQATREWTELEYNKCPNCPLTKDKHPHCPVALNMVEPVEFFKESISYDKTYIMIESGPRTYIGKVTIQEGIKSLVGACMVVSGCPVLDPLRPMLRAHLPFPNMEESVYRLVSMYLLGQYFLYREGKHPDWDLKQLRKICTEIQVVNRSFFKRLRGEKVKDASLNALVALDSFVAYAASFLEDNTLEDLKGLFGNYLQDFRS